MSILVTGGAGYIGSHVVRLLLERGETPVIVDDLSNGRADRNPGVAIEHVDLIADDAADLLTGVIRDNDVDAVIHLAALKAVGESVGQPARYYRHNIGSLANVLSAVQRAGVQQFVFSSSAAVYGASDRPLVETDATVPVNPYGETKLAGEWLSAAVAHAAGLRAVSLRYFNVAGAGWPELGDTSANNLIPMVFQRLEDGAAPVIFGDDYGTPDGTCIRDYIHVLDVAEAHIAALNALNGFEPGHRVLNVGTGVGSSVREIVNVVLDVSGSDARPMVVARRAGDPAVVVAAVGRIRETIGWSTRFGIREAVQSAWDAHRFLHASS